MIGYVVVIGKGKPIGFDYNEETSEGPFFLVFETLKNANVCLREQLYNFPEAYIMKVEVIQK